MLNPPPDLKDFSALCDAICQRDDSPEFTHVLTGVRNRDALLIGVSLILLVENYLNQREA